MNKESPMQPIRTIDYRERPSISDFAYYITSINGRLRDSVSAAMREVKDRYGIEVKQIPWGEVPKFDRHVPYVLVDTGSFILPTLRSEDLDYIKSLAQLPDARVNLTASFADSRLAFQNSGYGVPPEELIPSLDKKFGINTIFADDIVNGVVRTNSARDIADNMVCETIRLKYDAIRDNSDDKREALSKAQEKLRPDIEKLRRIYEEYGLFHRGPTDGALVFTADGGFITSQTKTDKTTMTPNNFSLVHGYSEEDSTVSFTGDKIPTSDIEIVNALDALKKYRLAVHFHHNRITRGARFEDHKTRSVIEYGRFESVREILEEMERIGDNWLILKEHGILWFGDSAEEFSKFVSHTLNLPETSTQG